MVHDTAHGFVKAPEPDGPEGDVPEAVIDLFEADLELGEGEWLVIVNWRSVADAEASMFSFSDAPAAAPFMSKVDASTMRMKRYMRK